MPGTTTAVDYVRLAQDIKRWAKQLGFHDVGVADPMLADDERRLLDWLGKGRHGEMRYMAKHGLKRSRPERLVPGTLRVVCVRMDYAPPALLGAPAVLADPRLAYVSRYALGRDYHKVVRHRLQKLAVTPDPGVIEVNIHPAETWDQMVRDTSILYEEARLARLGTGVPARLAKRATTSARCRAHKLIPVCQHPAIARPIE